jgi:hypothetical protein
MSKNEESNNTDNKGTDKTQEISLATAEKLDYGMLYSKEIPVTRKKKVK